MYLLISGKCLILLFCYEMFNVEFVDVKQGVKIFDVARKYLKYFVFIFNQFLMVLICRIKINPYFNG